MTVDDVVLVQLKVGEWSAILQLLGKYPFDQVAGLIGGIQQQIQLQQQAEGQQASNRAVRPTGSLNGPQLDP